MNAVEGGGEDLEDLDGGEWSLVFHGKVLQRGTVNGRISCRGDFPLFFP